MLDRTILVVQWLRMLLPMQGTQVQSLVWEDPTCCESTKPLSYNYGAHALEPVLMNKRSHHIKMKSSAHWLQLEKVCTQQRPSTTKNKNKNFKCWTE